MSHSFLITLFNMSINAGWTILAVMLIRFLLRKHAPKRFLCALWAFAAFRLICPFTLSSFLSLIPSAEIVPKNIEYTAAPAIHTGIAVINRTVNPVITRHLAPSAGNVVSSVNPMQVLFFVLSIVWAIGVLIMLGAAAFSWLRLRKAIRAGIPMEENVFLCDEISSPFLVGIFSPRIFLPPHLSDEQRGPVLAHERAHLARRDNWWKAFAYLLLCVYWFHPLVWAAFILFCRDLELACDESVIHHLTLEDRKAYSRALVSCSTGKRRVLICPLAFGETGVKARVLAVLSYKKPARLAILFAVTACLLLGVCFLTNPLASSGQDKPPAGSPAVMETDADKDASPSAEDEEDDPTEKEDTTSAGAEDNPDEFPLLRIGIEIEQCIARQRDGYADPELDYRFTHESFPGVTFRCTYEAVYAKSDEDDEWTTLIWGTPVLDLHLFDATGDGYPDLCATCCVGSGIIDTRVIVYDYRNEKCYTLADRMKFDYQLTQTFSGKLAIKKSEYGIFPAPAEALAYGPLFLDTRELEGQETFPFIPFSPDEEADVLLRTYKNRRTEAGSFRDEVSLVLWGGGHFSMSFSILSSYAGIGEYTIQDDILTLKTDDGLYTFIFRMVGDTIVYDQEASGGVSIWELKDGLVLR